MIASLPVDYIPVRRVALLLSGVGIENRGAERLILDLARQLGRWYEVTLLCGGRHVDRRLRIRRLPCVARRTILARAIGRPYPAVGRLTRRLHLDPCGVEGLTFALSAVPALLGSRYDVCVTSGGVWAARACRIVRSLVGTPFVYLAGGICSEIDNAREHPDRHVFCNPDGLDIVSGALPGCGRVLIPHGVDTDRFVPCPAGRDLGLERPLVLCVGALEPEKSIERVIHAVAALPRGGLVVVGQGSRRERIGQLGTTLLGPRRFRLESARLEEMPAYYNACDVFTLPSPREPFGLVYLEAMACNKPVVAPRDRVRELIVGHAGVLCDVTSPTMYARTLMDVAATDFGDEPRRQAMKFEWGLVAERYRNVIEELVGGSRGRAIA